MLFQQSFERTIGLFVTLSFQDHNLLIFRKKVGPEKKVRIIEISEVRLYKFDRVKKRLLDYKAYSALYQQTPPPPKCHQGFHINLQKTKNFSFTFYITMGTACISKWNASNFSVSKVI